MVLDWRQHFPYPQPRQIQAEALQALADNWDDYDCFILSAPTAFGKTAVARTLMGAFRSCSVITPTNLLVDQFLAEFPDTPTLRRLDSYHCEKWDRPCSVTRGKCRQFCSVRRDGAACTASADLSTAKYRRGPGVYNYHVYLAHKLYRDVLVVDEAHNLIPVIQDRLSLTIWQHDYRYPSNMYRPEQIRDWLATLPERTRAHQKMAALGEAVSSKCPQYVIRRTEKEFNGKGTLRGEPEMRDCLELLPVDISDAPPMFWPGLGGYSPNQSGGCARPAGKVAKLVLMSATIGPKDVESLGLGRRKRVLYIDCKSPIPSCNRPILPLDTVSVNRFVLTSRGGIDKIANEIGRIADHHLGEKGVIHATYQLATLLRDALPGVRYMFHDRNSKRDVYQQFRDSDPAEGRILVASGMYEGIDLPEDLGRWQVIAKVPWKSLGDPAIAHLAERNPDWYTWECIRTVIQACGRICRTPEDYGVTYVLDTSFWRMLSEGYKMLPEWWLEALQLTAEQKLKLDRIRADTYK